MAPGNKVAWENLSGYHILKFEEMGKELRRSYTGWEI